jgi:tRNA nucleotidyltransferase (CCA-adding enzyme)
MSQDNSFSFNQIVEILSSVTKSLKVESYLVGGCVRDHLLGRPTLDYDVVVIGSPKQFAQLVAKKLNLTIKKRSQFETLQAASDKMTIDFARARREVYPKPGALPQVSPTDSIVEDLKRRDFTINSIALSLNPGEIGKIVDPLKGVADLKRGVIRVLHKGSFIDDPTRAFRAIRYSHRFSFSYSEETENEFSFAIEILPTISFERIKNELVRISIEDRRADMYQDILERKLLSFIGTPDSPPDFDALDGLLEKRIEDHWLYFFLLLVGKEPDLERLKLKRSEREEVLRLLNLWKTDISEDLVTAHEELRDLNDDAVKFLMVVLGKEDFLLNYLKRRKEARPILRGDDLIKLGIEESPQIGQVLKMIELKRLEGVLKTREEEERFVRDLIKKGGSPQGETP